MELPRATVPSGTRARLLEQEIVQKRLVLLNKISASAREPFSTRKLFRLYPIPAPGYRSNASGVLYDIGYRGYSWSFATSGIHSLDLNFYSRYLSSSYADYRAHGFQLRCLSE